MADYLGLDPGFLRADLRFLRIIYIGISVSYLLADYSKIRGKWKCCGGFGHVTFYLILVEECYNVTRYGCFQSATFRVTFWIGTHPENETI